MLLLLLLLVIDFLQGIYNCALEAVFVGYIVFAAVQYFQFRAHVLLFRALNILHVYISTFRSVCAVPNMAVFCSALISCFPGELLRYFLSDLEKSPVATIITFVLT